MVGGVGGGGRGRCLSWERVVVGFGGDESSGVLFFGGEFWGVNN